MKAVWLAIVIPALCLGACNRPGSLESVGERGRFAGVGIYSADRMWSQIVGSDEAKSPASARLKDDTEVIVVADTRTGELRQCGNLSGFCVGMNPWSKPLAKAQSAPLSVLKHEEDFERDRAGKPDLTLEVRPKPVPKPKSESGAPDLANKS